MRNTALAGLPRQLRPHGPAGRGRCQAAGEAKQGSEDRSIGVWRSLASALRSGRRGRRFESAHSDAERPGKRVGRRRWRAAFLLGQAVTRRTTSYRDMAHR